VFSCCSMAVPVEPIRPSVLPPTSSADGPSASVLVIAFPGGAATASLVQQALRRSSRSLVPVLVMEVGQSFAALQLG